MKLFDADAAEVFDSRDACRTWINERVIRFKMVLSSVRLPNGVVGSAMRKTDGQIVSTKSVDYKEMALDEPLSDYAKPVRHGKKWVAAITKRGSS